MKIKVCEFIGRLQDGGAETLVKDYALMLDKNKFDVVILCEDYVENSSVYKTLIKNNVKIVTMYEKSFFFNKVLARLFGKKYVARLFEKYIKDINPDVLHTHLELLEVLYYAKESLKGMKLWYTCHNPPELMIGKQNPKEEMACYYLLGNNNLHIIALHENMAEEINEKFSIKDTKVIRNAIDLDRFRNVEKTKKEIRESLGLNESDYVIGQIGRFTYQKNPEFTVEVFNELLKKKSNSKLLLIGRGSQENQLRKQVSDLGMDDSVQFLISRDDIPDLFKAMDVFMLPSRFEGLGIVLIEAQASGLPCVVSQHIPSEAYQSNKITRLNLSDPIDVWVDALLDPKGNIDKYGNIENYDMKKEIKKLEELYSN